VTDARKIELLKILAEGCHKHPAYRAKRQVKIDCQPCVVGIEAIIAGIIVSLVGNKRINQRFPK
jgi:hypothetical protein